MATIAKKDNLTEALETQLRGDVLDAEHPDYGEARKLCAGRLRACGGRVDALAMSERATKQPERGRVAS